MLKKSTFDFLRLIVKHNDRTWFAENKYLYEEAKTDLHQFITPLIKVLAQIDPHFSADTPAKKCLLRIYRDVRFSANKAPYKTNYGIVFDVKGYGPNTPSYYLHLESGNCFFGGGFWMPEKEILKKIREEIDYSGDEFSALIHHPDFKKIFHLDKNDTLKKAPKGYEIDHPMIEYLKLKSFIVSYPLKEDEFLNPQISDKLKIAFETIQPFILFLRKAIDS